MHVAVLGSQPLVCVVHHDDLLAAVHVGRSSTAWRISCLSPSRALGSRHRRERVEERGSIRAGSLALVVMLDRARSGVLRNGFNWAYDHVCGCNLAERSDAQGWTKDERNAKPVEYGTCSCFLSSRDVRYPTNNFKITNSTLSVRFMGPVHISSLVGIKCDILPRLKM
jgi:hypothetical protein